MSSRKSINVVALIMAAGGSTRLDSPKQLLRWGNDYLVNAIIDIISASNVTSIHLVLGCIADEINEVVKKRENLSIVLNSDWQTGMSSSIKAGIASLDENVDAALILLVDQPFITTELLDRLIEEMEISDHEIVAPRVNGQQCNPVLFRKALFPEIMKISGDRGAKSLLKNREVAWVDWPDERLMLDIDSIENYLEALRLRTD